jgi:hypothetical protein
MFPENEHLQSTGLPRLTLELRMMEDKENLPDAGSIDLETKADIKIHVCSRSVGRPKTDCKEKTIIQKID